MASWHSSNTAFAAARAKGATLFYDPVYHQRPAPLALTSPSAAASMDDFATYGSLHVTSPLTLHAAAAPPPPPSTDDTSPVPPKKIHPL